MKLFWRCQPFFRKCVKRKRKEKEKYHAAGDSDNRHTKRTPRHFCRCRSEYHLTAKFSKPSKENENWIKQVRFNERGNRALQKECENSKNNKVQKIYAYMAHISENAECPSKNFGDSLQNTNWILYL